MPRDFLVIAVVTEDGKLTRRAIRVIAYSAPAMFTTGARQSLAVERKRVGMSRV